MSNLGKRLARLEGEGAGSDFLPIIALDDLVLGEGDAPQPWPEDLLGVRFADASGRHRKPGESVEAFRRRLCVEHGQRGPAGALPFAFLAGFITGE